MTNDLKNFLEEERVKFVDKFFDKETAWGSKDIYLMAGENCNSTGLLLKDREDHDTRLINFVLDLVEKGVEKKKQYGDTKDAYEFVLSTKDISTIINNLRV